MTREMENVLQIEDATEQLGVVKSKDDSDIIQDMKWTFTRYPSCCWCLEWLQDWPQRGIVTWMMQTSCARKEWVQTGRKLAFCYDETVSATLLLTLKKPEWPQAMSRIQWYFNSLDETCFLNKRLALWGTFWDVSTSTKASLGIANGSILYAKFLRFLFFPYHYHCNGFK